MNNKLFYDAQDISIQLGVSKAYAYKIIRKLNDELKKQGFITISGKVNKDYYDERVYHSVRKGER